MVRYKFGVISCIISFILAFPSLLPRLAAPFSQHVTTLGSNIHCLLSSYCLGTLVMHCMSQKCWKCRTSWKKCNKTTTTTTTTWQREVICKLHCMCCRLRIRLLCFFKYGFTLNKTQVNNNYFTVGIKSNVLQRCIVPLKHIICPKLLIMKGY